MNATKNTKTSTATAKAKAASKPRKATNAGKAKTPTPPATAKGKKGKASASFKMVRLPAHFEGDGGVKVDVTEKAVTFSQGLIEVIFAPRNAHFFPRDITAHKGQKMEHPIKAGSVSLVRGSVGVCFSPDDTDIINAILTAKAKAKGKASKD